MLALEFGHPRSPNEIPYITDEEQNNRHDGMVDLEQGIEQVREQRKEVELRQRNTEDIHESVLSIPLRNERKEEDNGLQTRQKEEEFLKHPPDHSFFIGITVLKGHVSTTKRKD